MALAGTDLYLVNRGGVDYQVAFDKIKEDILSAVPDFEMEGALVYKGAVASVDDLPKDAAGGEIYSVGTTYYVKTHSGFEEMGKADEVNLDGYAKTEDIPTDNAQLSNGAGYITAGDLPEAPEAPEAPVQSVDGKTGEVDLSSSYLAKNISSLPDLPTL